MKFGITFLAAALFAFLSPSTVRAAGPLVGVQATNSQIRLIWPASAGLSYQIDGTPEISPFSLWSTVSASISLNGGTAGALVSASSNYQFFRVSVLPNDGQPSVRFLSPTNGAIVSGLFKIAVVAMDDRKVQTVTLWIDGTPWQTLTNGDTVFPVQSKHFANGSHSFRVTAQDNAGDFGPGGGASATVSANEGAAGPLVLNFQNSLRWPDGDIDFDDGYSIRAETDLFPTNFTVYVEDEAGRSVRTLTGQTTDGIITAYWDGLDANGNAAPAGFTYPIEIVLGPPASGGSQILRSGGQTFTPVTNRYGMVDYEVTEETRLDSDAIGSGVRAETGAKQDLLPPLPEAPKHPVNRRVSARKMRLSASTEASSLSPMSNAAQVNSVERPPFRHGPIVSGQIVLARQQFQSSLAGAAFNSVVASHFVNVQNLVAGAELDGSLPGDRSVASPGIFTLNSAAAWGSYSNVLLNTSSGLRHLYYFGHGGPKGIGFSENTPTVGLRDTDIALALRNGRKPLVDESGRVWFPSRYPFRFVFLNGCSTASGFLPESFGIPAMLKKSLAATSRRCFLGWTNTVRNSIANNAHIQFSDRFWREWIPVNGPYDSVTIFTAIDIAASNAPGVSTNALARFGDQSLKWGE